MNKLLDLIQNLRSVQFEDWPKSITLRAVGANASGILDSAKITYRGLQYYIYYHHKESAYIVEHD